MDTPIPPSPASDRPSAAREWLLVTAMLTVAWLPLICAGLVLLAAAVFADLWPLVGMPLAWLLVGLARAAGGRDRLPGRAVQPGDEPELAELVRNAAARLHFDAPLLVRIVPLPTAALGRVKVAGERSYVLLLGLPLLRALTAAQLAAVVGHELAHEQHMHDRRTSGLLNARGMLARRLEGRFRPLAPLAAPLLRVSRPCAWQTELAADADAARLAGTSATREALELTGLMEAAFDGLAEGWLSDLAVNQTYPQDFYDAFDAALRDPLVRHRSARIAAEDDAIDPYAMADHPPLAERVSALPHAEGASAYSTEPLTLHRAAAIERWCVEQLAGLEGPLDGGAPETVGKTRPPSRNRDRYDPPQPVRLLDLDADRLHPPADAEARLLLLSATGQDTPERALSATLDAVADGSWTRLARRIESGLRWVPAAARPTALREVMAGAVGTTLLGVLREAGWTYASRWLSTVLIAPDGTVVDLYELLVAAVDSGDPAAVRALLQTAGTEEVESV
ncbi:M48 family metalloprotease [Streptomyces sp. NBC_01538]|uniref:M48 family metalloprotease n=1 Tax=Streptomyces sp. NBC_01538 TaxID=2903897 RepID=UPI0038647388